MLNRIIAVVMATLFAVSFAACKAGSANGNGNSGNGLNSKTYAQQSFDGASVHGGMNPAVNSAGELVTASQQVGQPAAVTTWDLGGKKENTVNTDVTDTVSMLALGLKDEVYLLATPKGGNPTVHVLDPTGKTIKTIELTGLQPQGMMQTSRGQALPGGSTNSQVRTPDAMIIGMQAAPDGAVILSALGVGVVQFDAYGKQVSAYGQAGGMISYIAMNEKNQLLVYSMVGGTSQIVTYNTLNGKQISSLDAPAMPEVRALFYDRQGKRLLYMTESDVLQLSVDGKTSAVLATFNDFNLIDGVRQIMNFAVDKNGTIYLADSNTSDSGTFATNPGGNSAASPSEGQSSQKGSGSSVSVYGKALAGGGVNEMIRLALVDASTIPAKKTITVAALDGSQLLDQVISAFQKAYPNYKVNLKLYDLTAVGMQSFAGPGVKVVTKLQADEPQQDMTSFIQAMNTDIMSGNGPDIIVLDNLPWYKYVDKGLLVDLGQLMTDKKFDTKQYYTNVFDGCKNGGKLYGVPAFFSYTLLAGKSQYMPESNSPTLEDFIAKAKALPQGVSAFGNQDATLIFEECSQFCYPELVDTTAHKAYFNSSEFIQAMKEFKDLIGSNASTNSKQDAQAEQLNGDVAYNAVNMDNPMQLAIRRAILGDDMKITSMPTLSGGCSNPFSAAIMLGINANSKNQEAAWNFIKTMLSADIQGSQSNQMGNGYPVLKSAAQKMVNDLKTGLALGKMRAVIQISGGKTVEAKPLSDADYQSILNTLSKLNTLQALDPNVVNIINDELPTFFSGQKKAEDVAKLIQDRVNTLLNE